MLVLFETAAGLALFKVLNKGKIENAEVRAAKCSSQAILASFWSRQLMDLSVTVCRTSQATLRPWMPPRRSGTCRKGLQSCREVGSCTHPDLSCPADGQAEGV